MKTVITYYGGKQMMLRHILPLIPPHVLYCEPFIGGGALYFAKEPSKVEVINDLNGEIANFYVVLKTKFTDLNELVQQSLHSRLYHQFASFVYNHPSIFSDIRRAWAVWCLANQSYVSKLNGGWAYARQSDKCSKKVTNNKKRFDELLATRLENTQIECRPAVKVIESRDCETAFFYLDPPYVNSNQGHYQGYTQSDFNELLDACVKIKGKFLMSSYPNDVLQEYVEENGWHQIDFDKPLAAGPAGKRKRKTEVLTANYPISKE